MRLLSLSLLAASAIALSAPAALADTFQVSYLNAGVQASSSSNYVENFNNATVNNGTLTTTFNNSGITGTYTGGVQLQSANVYGGANNTGNFIQPIFTSNNTGNSYTLSLSQGVNYFGLWFSALDAGNQLSFYNGNTLLYTFGAQQFINGVGACPGSAYCGNPNYAAGNGTNDPNEQFAFINFYDATATFNKIVFAETPNAGYSNFESDNHTVGNLASTPGGTQLSPVPEPGSLALLGTGVTGIAGLIRRNRRS